jgi:flagellar hook-length control protein FliK
MIDPTKKADNPSRSYAGGSNKFGGPGSVDSHGRRREKGPATASSHPAKDGKDSRPIAESKSATKARGSKPAQKATRDSLASKNGTEKGKGVSVKKKSGILRKTKGLEVAGSVLLAGTKKDLSGVATKAGAVAKATRHLASETVQAVKGATLTALGAKAAEARSKPTTAARAAGKKGQKVSAKKPQPVDNLRLLALLHSGSGLNGSNRNGSNPGQSQAPVTINGALGEQNQQSLAGFQAAVHHESGNQAAGITIIDLRQANQNGDPNSNSGGSRNHSQGSGNVRLFQLADIGSNVANRLDGQTSMTQVSATPSQGRGFSALTDQIVKQTGILLKDNNSGEIRLVLKPEHLGQLRIKIDMNNNSLTGKIFVQNHDALRLVQQNLDSLARALRDSGFTTAELNVSVGGKDAGERKRGGSSPLPSVRPVGEVKDFDNGAGAAEITGSTYSLVNLVI